MANSQSRQSFLGDDSEEILISVTAGLVGYSGGGSHFGQQLAHVGVGNFVIVDPQLIEDTNLTRLVGGTSADVLAQTVKVEIAKRLIQSVRPDATVDIYQDDWRNVVSALRRSDVIFGAVDTYRDRNEVERQARRSMTPYIDIGMDISKIGDEFHISGQIALSIPGGPCLWCLGILREELLAQEAADYGHAGVRQQVVWSNGVLASTAISMFMSLILPWSTTPMPLLLEYDGNRGTVVPSMKLQYVAQTCPHFSNDTDLGDPFWKLSKEIADGTE